MADARHYEIRLLDRTLAEFSIEDGPFGTEVCGVEYDDSARALMPCGLSLDPEGIWEWLELRSIPTNRKNAQRVCQELGFNLGDTEALYRVSMGLSLNDSYWVVPRGTAARFSEVNLYQNGFSEAIGMLAVAGEYRGGDLRGNTPELTTDGTLHKGWRIIGDKRVLYKGASDGYVPGEPLSEYVASLIACDSGLDAVEYGLDEWAGETCSTCADFATPSTSYVPFAVATGHTDLAGVLGWCALHGDDYLESVCDMLVFDALICNTDRHLTNFGVLRDNVTGLPISLAPIFDNGRSLFPNVVEDDQTQFALEAQLRSPSFGGRTFEELVSRIMGPRQRRLLERIAERGIVGNVLAPSRRVAALDGFIRSRARDLAAIPIVERDPLKEALAKAYGRKRPTDDAKIRLV